MQAKYNMIKEKEIIQGLKRGDIFLEESFYKEFYPRLSAFVATIIHGNNDIEDIVQDVFVKFFGALNRYEDRGVLFSYLCCIAKRTIIDKNYKRMNGKEIFTTDLNKTVIGGEYDFIDTFNYDGLVEQRDNARKVRKLVFGLPRDQRNAICMKYFKFMKHKEMSKVAGTSDATMMSRVFRGIKSIRRKLLGRTASRKVSNPPGPEPGDRWSEASLAD